MVDTDTDISDEERAVLEWREQQFRMLGINDVAVTMLALSPVDPHDAERLIQAGCPPDLASDILL